MIKLKCGPISIGQLLIQYDECSCKRKMRWEDRDIQGEGHVLTKAEIRVMQLLAKEYQGLVATIRNQKEARKDFYPMSKMPLLIT